MRLLHPPKLVRHTEVITRRNRVNIFLLVLPLKFKTNLEAIPWKSSWPLTVRWNCWWKKPFTENTGLFLGSKAFWGMFTVGVLITQTFISNIPRFTHENCTWSIPSSHNHGSVKHECISPIVITYLPNTTPFSTTNHGYWRRNKNPYPP